MKRDRRNDYVGDPARQCGSKAGYPTKRKAKLMLRRHRGRSQNMTVYRCPWCRQFHLGHGPGSATA